MLKPLIIWGAKGHAKVLHEFTAQIGYDLVALFDNEAVAVSPVVGFAVYHGEKGFLRWRAENPDVTAEAMVAIGGQRGRDRLEIHRFLAEHGVMPATAIHPAAYVGRTAQLGVGCQVLAQATVGAEARLGDACIINTAAGVDHECSLGNGVHLAPGARLGGCVTVGDFTFIAIGAVVLPNLKIGSNSIVGAGAVVTRDVPDNTIVYGNPARHIRDNPTH